MIFGIGIDILDIHLFTESFNKSKRFCKRVFTENEIVYCESKLNKQQHYSVRFAAKEAVLKAIGTGWNEGAQWTQIEIKNDRNGKPTFICTGEVLKKLYEKNICNLYLSLSHSETKAIAFVILETK